ncbi:hypothetical protein QBC44DRAFT_293894 [Cladorrhinum sp. PSN332]|nr:hypothetical protein QBC44DRAFT_293894 [Cladorrhinum sp. PSN332]
MSFQSAQLQKQLDASKLFIAQQPDNKEKAAPVTTTDHDFFDFDHIKRFVSVTTVTDILVTGKPKVKPHTASMVAKPICESYLRIFFIFFTIGAPHSVQQFVHRHVTDDRLPIHTAAELNALVPELASSPAISSAFLEAQWRFLPWIFERDTLHMNLPSRVILPFVGERLIAEGAEGILTVVEIPNNLQRLYDADPSSDDNVTLVRKVLKTSNGGQNVGTRERACLELLHMLKHPNIIPLLTSYTRGTQHAMLFPKYSMDLAAFLNQPTRIGAFKHESTFISAIRDLASALQAVHTFNHRAAHNPILIARHGYHHDLRPANILVDDNTFILADFGLAEPKLLHEEPSREFKKNLGHYVAPECFGEGLQALHVGRSYDIWALGCLVAELATYMERGPAGVAEFRSLRTTPSFHNKKVKEGYFFSPCPNALKPQVSSWLNSALSEQAEHAITRSLAAFCRKVLEPELSSRPSVDICLSHLSYLHAKSLFYECHSLMKQVLDAATVEGMPSAVTPLTLGELRTDMARLEAFGAVMHMFGDGAFNPSSFQNHAICGFIREHLTRSRAHLHLVHEAFNDTKHLLARLTLQTKLQGPSMQPASAAQESFRQCLSQICNALPDSAQQLLNSTWRKYGQERHWERPDLIPAGENEMQIRGRGHQAYDHDLHRRIERLDLLLRGEPVKRGDWSERLGDLDQNMILDWSQIKELRDFDRSRSKALYTPSGTNQGKKGTVLIEWIFITQMNPDETHEERIKKTLILANLLKGPHPAGFRLLACVGFLRPRNPKKNSDTRDSQYGFVYNHPDGCADKVPVTLGTLLSVEKTKKSPRSLTLGDKFHMAKSLVGTLFELHSCNWLHKNISPENVLFFRDSDTDPNNSGLDLEHPYLIGFHHSRPQGEFYSDLWSANPNEDLVFYQHAEYRRQQPSLTTKRFEKKYDYYGLGVILLEIGYWKLCGDLWRERTSKREKGLERSEFQARLVDRYVPDLAVIMGRAYRDAVIACLTAYKGSESEVLGSGPGRDEDSWFHREVVDKLEKCFVG